MFKLLSIILIIVASLSASDKVFKFYEVDEKDGLIYKDSSKFTGVFKKRNFRITVKDGKVSKLDVYSIDDKIASFNIFNNQFNGKAYVNHRVLGTQNLFYEDGCIKTIQTKDYKEVFEDCNFKEGVTSLNKEYVLSSRYPYVFELDIFSFNINAYIFKKRSLVNGLVNTKAGQKVYRNSKIKRLIIGVPQAGLNYVISLDKNEKVHSIMKFYMDSETSVIAFFKDENLSHIVSFDKDINLIEKYKDSKLLSRENLNNPDKIDFNLLENLSDVIVNHDGKIYSDIVLE